MFIVKLISNKLFFGFKDLNNIHINNIITLYHMNITNMTVRQNVLTLKWFCRNVIRRNDFR